MAGDSIAPIAVNIKQATVITGLGRTALYQALRDGRLGCFRVGRRVLFSREHLEQFLRAHESNGGKAATA